MADLERHDAQALDKRIRELEQRLQQEGTLLPVEYARPQAPKPYWAAAISFIALICGYLGIGLPQHYYQFMFAALVLLLAYHRGVLVLYERYWRWLHLTLNYLLMCLVLKLLIGGGINYPLDWLKVPTISKVPQQGDESWFGRVVPDLEIRWEGISSVSDWSFDMTRIQALLLIVTVLGALLRFQPFASLTALALLLISLPTFFQFNWDWIILFLVFGSTAMYLQSDTGPRRLSSRRRQ